jgi:hypothetical protein
MSEKEERYYRVVCLNLDTDEERYALVKTKNMGDAIRKVENDHKMPTDFEIYSAAKVMLELLDRGKVVWV